MVGGRATARRPRNPGRRTSRDTGFWNASASRRQTELKAPLTSTRNRRRSLTPWRMPGGHQAKSAISIKCIRFISGPGLKVRREGVGSGSSEPNAPAASMSSTPTSAPTSARSHPTFGMTTGIVRESGGQAWADAVAANELMTSLRLQKPRPVDHEYRLTVISLTGHALENRSKVCSQRQSSRKLCSRGGSGAGAAASQSPSRHSFPGMRKKTTQPTKKTSPMIYLSPNALSSHAKASKNSLSVGLT